MEMQFRINEDTPGWLAVLVLTVAILATGRLFVLSYRRNAKRAFVITGILGYVLLALAALRPVKLVRRGRAIGPKVVLLVDGSRRLNLQTENSTRVDQAKVAVKALLQHYRSARVSVAVFGDGAAKVVKTPSSIAEMLGRSNGSDLVTAWNSLLDVAGERPAAVVVVSDGRFTRPLSIDSAIASPLPATMTGIPVHSVDIGGEALPDASIRAVNSLGEAIAHQLLTLKVEIACSGGLKCGKIPVVIRALEKGKPPRELARLEGDLAGKETQLLDFDIVLERAGSQIVEVAMLAQPGDRIAENNVRLIPFLVSRDRVRLLHIAGCPSYDVRELRRWLKGNTSVDLVSYFILRTDEDDPNTQDNASELSLIPFPVDELFSQHLPSFDAVILQDIDAARYHLDNHLERLARYVEQGGGLILVGGPSAFSGGSYVHSALERVIPTVLVVSHNPFDTVEFVPKMTNEAQHAPILEPLRRLLGDRLPSFPGANTLGPPKTGAIVLWEHPQRAFLPVKGLAITSGPMPVLAISDIHEGRVVEVALDATYRLAWGSFAAESSGRAYGALWEALLGWVMHEQRFEPFRGEIAGECMAGEPVTTRWSVPSTARGQLTVNVEQLGQSEAQQYHQQVILDSSGASEVRFDGLPSGGFTAKAQINGGPPARLDFACERGGLAFADSRPDHDRLRKLAESTGGKSVNPNKIDDLPVPPSSFVDETRRSQPLAPSWLWSALAALFLGGHWLAARSTGFR